MVIGMGLILFFALGMGAPLLFYGHWYGPYFVFCPWYGRPSFILWSLVRASLLFALGTGISLFSFDPRYGSFLFFFALGMGSDLDSALGMGVGCCEQMSNVDPLPVPAGLGNKVVVGKSVYLVYFGF